jgi:hypothetical protein
MTPASSVLTAMLLAAGGLSKPPASASTEPSPSAQEYDKFYHGLDEVNLLEGLSAGANPSASTLHIALTEHSADLLKRSSPPRLAQFPNWCQDTQARLCPPGLSTAHCRPILHDANLWHPRHAPQIVSPHNSSCLLLPRAHAHCLRALYPVRCFTF